MSFEEGDGNAPLAPFRKRPRALLLLLANSKEKGERGKEEREDFAFAFTFEVNRTITCQARGRRLAVRVCA